MKVKLPQYAIKHYNSVFNELLLELKPVEISSPPIQSPTPHYVQTISANDVIDIKISTVDGFGNLTGKYFVSNGKQIGLSDDSCKRCNKTALVLSLRKEICNLVSEQYIIDTIYTWFEQKYNGELENDFEFVDYILNQIQTEVKPYTISIPISHFTIENEFEIGKVKYHYYGKKLFDDIEIEYLKNVKSEEDIKGVKHSIISERKKYQGLVFGTIKVTAERNKAVELARKSIDKSLIVIKFFAPTVFIPEEPLYIGRFGITRIIENHEFVFDKKLPVIQTKIDEKKQIYLHIGKKELHLFEQNGFNTLSQLIFQNDYYVFEEMCISCIKYFTEALSIIDFNDRLVYLLISIESLLSKDENESIQDNVSRRLAFLTDKELEKRKLTIKNFKKAYGFRSKLLHHGKKQSEIKIIDFLQIKIWLALRKALSITNKIKTKSEFIEYLEDRILRG